MAVNIQIIVYWDYATYSEEYVLKFQSNLLLQFSGQMSCKVP